MLDRVSAEKALRDAAIDGPMSIEGPTAERLLQADGAAVVEKYSRTVTISRADGDETVAIEGSRWKVQQAPLDRLYSRNLLSPDPSRNAALKRAADAYLAAAVSSGMEALKGFDTTKGPSTRGGGGLLGSEWRCDAFDRFSAMVDCMDRLERIAVDRIVTQEQSLEDVGRIISHATDRKTAAAIAAHDLRRGLEKIAIHLGFLLPRQ